MTDTFVSYHHDVSSPARSAAAVTPHDTDPLAAVSRALYVGGTGSGSLTVTMADGSSAAFTGIVAPIVLPIRVTHVLATGTNVAGIVALW